MSERTSQYLEKMKRPRVFIPAILLLLMLTGAVGYLILLNPRGFLIRWAQAAMPEQITMISTGPYPEDAEFQQLKKVGVKYIVSLLDPRLPYEKDLVDRETPLAQKYGMTLKVFPMASLFNRKIFPDYDEQQRKAVEFLKNLDGPAYMHCYLGKHRVLHIRDELIKAGVPKRYWTPASSNKEYWEIINRVDEAWKEFRQKNYGKVVEILEPVKVRDADVTSLRGWSRFRLGLIEEATEDFRQGLESDPSNPRNLIGLGYCYLRTEQPVLAQRQFSAVLEQIPDNREALVGVGLAHLRLQNMAAAVQVFQKALEANPDDAEVRDYLRKAQGL